MASRCISLSKPTLPLFKSAISKPTLKPTHAPSPCLPSIRSSFTMSRTVSQLGCLQSLLPFHSAVSSARLTSCLGLDSNLRSLSQGMLGSANPGV